MESRRQSESGKELIESVHKVKVFNPRACPGDPEHIENNGSPIKDFGNDSLKSRVYTQTLVSEEFIKRRVLMRPKRSPFVIVIFFMAAVMFFPCSLKNAEAGPRGGGAVAGPRGGAAVEGPGGNVAVEGPRGNVAVGTRYNILPDSARSLIVGERTYYVDDSGVYYLPCDDDDTVFCVVSAPQ